MNLTIGQLNNASLKKRSRTNSPASRPIVHQAKSNDLAFTGNIITGLQKIPFNNKTIEYTQANKITQKIDDILGDSFFTKQLKKAGIEVVDDKITISDKGVGSLLKDTLKYPFVDLPANILGSIAKLCKKMKFDNAAEKINNIPFVKKKMATIETEKALSFITNALSQFAPDSSKLTDDRTFEIYTKNFAKKVESGIIKPSKKYLSRDERTLNRLATSTVSALFGASDFYNISMLEKDDKNEAKKAGNGRFKQEMTRAGLSAGLTFLSLGVLDKFTKTNLMLNACVIAASSLISEIVSRKLSGTPIMRLTPKQAKEFAEKEKLKKSKKQQKIEKENSQNVQNTNSPTKTQQQANIVKLNNFKANLKNEQNTSKIYTSFKQKDGTFAAIEKMKKHEPDEYTMGEFTKGKKKNNLKKILLWTAIACNVFHFLNRGQSGNFKQDKMLKEIFEKNSDAINDFKLGKIEELPNEIKNQINTALKIKQKTFGDTTVGKGLEAVKNFITKRKETIDLKELVTTLEKIKTEEGSSISNILDKYIAEANNLITEENNGIIELSTDRVLGKGVYKGFTRIIDTIYQGLTLPARGLLLVIKKANKTDGLHKTAKNLIEVAGEKSAKDQKAEIGALSRIIKKHNNVRETILEKATGVIKDLFKGLKPSDSPSAQSKIVEEIKDNTRKLEVSQETSELANLSRTLVTIISTFFFVNDYRNRILIESEGRDLQKANAEQTDRIAHKASNFVINGTLMNLFNSVFNKTLNGSLLGATAIASMTELCNETLIRGTICQPTRKMNSRQEIIDFEEKQLNKKGLRGAWTKLYMKLTGKKPLSQKAKIKKSELKQETNQKALQAHQG